MKKNQIKVERIQTGTKTIFTIKNGMVYDMGGRKNVYCSCTGKTEATATPMEFKDGEVFCPNCHEKKVEVIQTYEQWKTEKDEKEKKLNDERLVNLHIIEAGSDWECGFKYYALSANIDYEDWLKVKEHFRYYKKGWSRGQELEWNYGEPVGWLTRNPKDVEKILVEAGLIKPENTMKAIDERKELERKAHEEEKQVKAKERAEIKKKMDDLKEDIQNVFDNAEKRVLSDVEANEHYFNPTYGKATVTTYTITDDSIIKVQNMGDFKYGVSVPYSEELDELIKEYHVLNEKVWNYK